MIVTPNPEFLLIACKDQRFRDILNKSALSLADGVALKYAICAMTENQLIHRQTGIDTLLLLAKLCHEKKKRLLLFGGRGGVSLKAAQFLSKNLSDAVIESVEPKNSPTVTDYLEIIKEKKPDVIAVALGQGTQERFITELLPHCPFVKIAIGVGGAIDMIAGNKSRAPLWMRRSGFEWLWRVLIEPKRFPRSLRASIVFPCVVIAETFKRRRFLTAFVRVMKDLLSIHTL